ncbi:hypothetical protein WDU94_008741 [Cyamophila willieti]
MARLFLTLLLISSVHSLEKYGTTDDHRVERKNNSIHGHNQEGSNNVNSIHGNNQEGSNNVNSIHGHNQEGGNDVNSIHGHNHEEVNNVNSMHGQKPEKGNDVSSTHVNKQEEDPAHGLSPYELLDEEDDYDDDDDEDEDDKKIQEQEKEEEDSNVSSDDPKQKEDKNVHFSWKDKDSFEDGGVLKHWNDTHRIEDEVTEDPNEKFIASLPTIPSNITRQGDPIMEGYTFVVDGYDEKLENEDDIWKVIIAIGHELGIMNPLEGVKNAERIWLDLPSMDRTPIVIQFYGKEPKDIWERQFGKRLKKGIIDPDAFNPHTGTPFYPKSFYPETTPFYTPNETTTDYPYNKTIDLNSTHVRIPPYPYNETPLHHYISMSTKPPETKEHMSTKRFKTKEHMSTKRFKTKKHMSTKRFKTKKRMSTKRSKTKNRMSTQRSKRNKAIQDKETYVNKEIQEK